MDQQAQVCVVCRYRKTNVSVLLLGKTSTILALAKQMYTPAEMRGCVLEVNKIYF
jgi:hypothetical protein